MSKQRSPVSLKAEKIYHDSNGKIELIEIAKQLNIPEGTVRSWKKRYNWDNKKDATLQNKNNDKRNVSNSKKKKEQPLPDEVEEVLNNSELTEKQKLFCIYYVKCFNATKAAKKAGYSDNTAYSIGWELLNKPEIRAEIQRLKQNKLNRALLSTDDIVQKYIDIAFSDITDYVRFGREEVPVMGPFGPIKVKGKDGKNKELTKIVNVVKFNESDSIDGTLINEVKQGKDGASIKLQDKMKALEWLANHMDLLDAATKEKLQLEREKFNADQKKENGDSKDVTIKVTLEDDET